MDVLIINPSFVMLSFLIKKKRKRKYNGNCMHLLQATKISDPIGAAPTGLAVAILREGQEQQHKGKT